MLSCFEIIPRDRVDKTGHIVLDAVPGEKVSYKVIDLLGGRCLIPVLASRWRPGRVCARPWSLPITGLLKDRRDRGIRSRSV